MLPPDKPDIEAANLSLAREWYKDLGLECSGVDLGDCLSYDLLQILGNVWLGELNAG